MRQVRLGRADLFNVRRHVVMRESDALGSTCRARGVHEKRQIRLGRDLWRPPA